MSVVRSASVLLVAVALLFASGCATRFRSEVHGDPNYDFGKIQRLVIRQPASAMPEQAAQNHALLVRELRRQLTAKGFELTSEDRADLLIYPSVGRHGKISVSGQNRLSAEEGRIILNFVVAAEGHTVWYGAIATTLDKRSDPQAEIPQAVAELLSHFPSRGQDIRPYADRV